MPVSATLDSRTGQLLVVDDDAMMRTLASRTLRQAGFEVVEADGGEAALALFASTAFDLVLLDVVMPGLDGYEVCQRIRALPSGSRIPVILLTGLNDTESIDVAYRCGATDFITKPINWTLLSHRVRYALRASATGEAIRRSSESLERVQRMARLGNWEAFPDGRMMCSPQLMDLFSVPGGAPLCVSMETFLSRVVPGDRERVERARLKLLQEGAGYQLEFEVERFDGVVRTVYEQAECTDTAAGPAGGVQGFTQDITDSAQARERIRQLAYYDDTTGLANRQYFNELAGHAVERARRNETCVAVLHVDIDRFKGVNDAFGRGLGDAVLATVAERLRSWVRGGEVTLFNQADEEQSVIARVGGNAFAVLIRDIVEREEAGVVAQQLLEVIAQPLQVEARSLVLSASIGISFFPHDAQDVAGLTRCAEQAVYAAKGAGRAQYRFFDEKMQERAASRLLQESDLRRGIADGELRLHFQPKVIAPEGRVVGAEALVRWQHPHRGLVPPGEFIAVAEETGLIQPLTDWVVEAACRSIRGWRDQGIATVPLSVNLAASSLTDTSLIQKLDALMDRFRLTPDCLVLEVTETILMRDVDFAVERLEALRSRGYGLSLDDFGTGYSSLSYLKLFPVDELKIDRAFVTDSARGGRDGVLAAAIIALGREFGLVVVAEGVETKEQSAFLLGHGCSLQQGYLFSKPVAEGVFERMLRAGFIAPAEVLPPVALKAVK